MAFTLVLTLDLKFGTHGSPLISGTAELFLSFKMNLKTFSESEYFTTTNGNTNTSIQFHHLCAYMCVCVCARTYVVLLFNHPPTPTLVSNSNTCMQITKSKIVS